MPPDPASGKVVWSLSEYPAAVPDADTVDRENDEPQVNKTPRASKKLIVWKSDQADTNGMNFRLVTGDESDSEQRQPGMEPVSEYEVGAEMVDVDLSHAMIPATLPPARRLPSDRFPYSTEPGDFVM
jgi:hypothetical protein